MFSYELLLPGSTYYWQYMLAIKANGNAPEDPWNGLLEVFTPGAPDKKWSDLPHNGLSSFSFGAY